MPSLLDHIKVNLSFVKDSIRQGGIANKRSPHWPKVERDHLAKQPSCQACGSVHNLQVHHIQPFHLHPELELDDSNLITLCENTAQNDHLHLGHLDNWKDYNPGVVVDAKAALVKKAQVTIATAQTK